MNNPRYSPEFKDEAVRQVIDRGYFVSEVAQWLGVSAHSLYKWATQLNLTNRMSRPHFEAWECPNFGASPKSTSAGIEGCVMGFKNRA